ncbi:MAG: DUF4143 domain-containing protein [Erysipelotrichaceae bacterium]|uniref:ATP-binding protein n=1 Tax=Floccifex sp. TaxID=2815810 RepID=UPI002A754E40|nr:DUF4143 domain-containing protein [Floccifex sp.]MDD7280808.1 DUF4143 domain-containing protein [Erysipelotrichaceae bacterium]MDY2957699.1 DUF4143 domain-containing protein [Floccifex sp.]
MKEFGENYYEKMFYFNFDSDDDLATIFQNKNATKIIELLSFIVGEKILPQKHLIIFDEIQECPNALNSLKYFYENANEYHVISAESLLGTLLAQPKSYPVGKVNLLDIGPLTFDEFLQAVDPSLYHYYQTINKGSKIEGIFHNKLNDLYNYYLIIGGMPECVNSWITYKDIKKVDTIQKELIQFYENDFSKYNGKVNAGRILMVFRSIVTQLSKDNHKFVYGLVRDGARAREFEEAIEWLVSAGMILRTYNVSKNEHPLNAYEKLNHFKLYLFDVGLLKQMASVSNESILIKKDFQFKGALTENYVLQQLQGLFDSRPKYYSPSANMEIDYLVQYGSDIIPIEVKAGESVESSSFKKCIKKYEPSKAIRYSKLGYEQNGNLTNIPLYLVRKTKELI